jgi:anti-sigma factor RsiW
MLPALLEGDLPSADETAVHAHVSGCEKCRESLATYRALEDSLALRREMVPPVEPLLRGLFAPAVSPALHRARVLMDAIFSFPGLASFFCLVIAWMAFAYSDVIAGWLNGVVDASSSVGRFGSWLADLSAAYSGGDMLLVSVAYGLMTVLLLGSGTWMTLRQVNSR